MGQGIFIALEGIDGSGQSTQTERVAAWLRAAGHAVYATKEPSGGPAGLLLRLALTRRLGRTMDDGVRPLDEATMALLFAADRMDHLASDVLPRLEAGTTVVCDRYTLSTYAYQSLGANLDLEWLRALNRHARVPDLTVLVDVPVEVSMERMRVRGAAERYEEASTLRRVRDNFHRLVPTLQAEGQHIDVVNGDAPPDAVQAAIVAHVEPLLSG